MWDVSADAGQPGSEVCYTVARRHGGAHHDGEGLPEVECRVDDGLGRLVRVQTD